MKRIAFRCQEVAEFIALKRKPTLPDRTVEATENMGKNGTTIHRPMKEPNETAAARIFRVSPHQ